MWMAGLMTTFDYIIVGAGSAGCVLADKLSANGRHSVLLIEAGPSDRRFWVQTPIGYGATYTDPKVNWRFYSEAEAGLGNRKMYVPRGKVLGGSSSINALVYHRGQSSDYDDWKRAGNVGWDYNSILPFFECFENVVGSDQQSQNISGKLTITDVADQYHPIKSAFFAMSRDLQIPYKNRCQMMGEGVYPYYITTRHGRRCSSATAFLWPAKGRQNLKVMTDATVTKLIIRDGAAVGVELIQHSRSQTFSAQAEIILTAGAIGSPHILQLSGIGSGKLCQSHGIVTVCDQPNVGKHLQDHLGINYFHLANRPTLNNVLGSWPHLIIAGVNYIMRRKGPLSLGVNQLGGLVRATPDASRLDTQLYINPITYSVTDDDTRRLTKPDRAPGFALSFNSCRPYSAGSVYIKSADAAMPPAIHGNYLDDQRDIKDVLRMARFIGRMQNSPSVQKLLAAPPETNLLALSDNEIIDDFRARSGTVFHPCGTCRMGPDRRHSVVDPQLRVHGVGKLRVADAAIFPNITSANTNAPTIAVAHKAADLILQS
jgi:choline dehydrogenase